jgi:phospholipid transport system transporter-binding protein
MIDADGGRLIVKVPLIIANARALLEAGRSALQSGELVFDFSEVTEADSSALAVMLGWLRAAEAARASIRFANIPQGVSSLAGLYGVTELLPLA